MKEIKINIKNNDIEAGRGDGQGQGNPPEGDGGADICECPECGYSEKHEKGKPCNEKKCPECGTPMVGKNKTKSADNSELIKTQIPITKINAKKRIVYGVVYAPERADSQGHFMQADTIEVMAHRFMLSSRKIDDYHSFVKGSGGIVESFIAREKDPDFPVGSWVLATKVFDEDVWKRILKKEIRAYSLAGVAMRGKEKEVESDWVDDKGEPVDPYDK